jgi:site-specific recombinase XerD
MEQFINKQLSGQTRKTYGLILTRFSKWLAGKDLPEGNKWVQEYQNELLKSGLSNKTVNMHVTVVGSFYKYKFGRKLLYDRLKEKKVQINFLSEEEVKKLLDSADGEFRTVLMFMLDTGVRVGELEEISRREHSEVKSEMTLVGKGGKQRIVIVGKETLKRLRPGLLFGKPWSVVMVQRHLRQLAKKNWIGKKIHPHMLRHTMATRMLWAGADIRDIQKMLGHSYLATTEVYTHVTDEHLREVWERCHDTQNSARRA